MTLYHGSNQEILTIDLSKSRPHKDFGKGFYLTENKEQAQKMAEQKVIQYGGIPTVNTYEFDEVNLNNPALRIKIFEGYNSRYFYLPLGRAEFIVHTADDGKEIKDLGTHMIGNREYVMKVKSVIMNDNRGMTCCCSAINALGLTMPVTFMMADVRPSYMPGEIKTRDLFQKSRS